jgi:hypothetical protein
MVVQLWIGGTQQINKMVVKELTVNGKLVVVGASDEPIQVPPFLMILERVDH